jgi:hypothetical protein
VILPPGPTQPACESRLLHLLRRRPGLLVSLPRNDPELARAAAGAGADALKVHINVHHDASGTHFGSFAEERSSLRAILAAVEIPVGLMVGAETVAGQEEVEQARRMGFDFLDAFAHQMPAWMLAVAGMAKMSAIDASYDTECIAALAVAGADMVEAAIIPHEGYGQPLTVADLAAYQRVRAATDLPIVVPTQRRITPDDLPVLIHKTGAGAVMIGAIVTGNDAAGIGDTTAAFRRALDAL